LDHFAWKGVLLKGWPVLSLLFFASIVTVAVIWERWKVFSKIKPDSKPFLDSVRNSQDVKKILSWCEKSDQPLAVIAYNVFRSTPGRDDMERVLQRTIQSLVQKLESNIFILGTIASVAPFVGLLGTVIGIIRSFSAFSLSNAGGASEVTLGISEALVGTAAGLVVAIPALLGYNFFVNKLRHYTQDWELAGGELIDVALSGRGR
jgi:biopolymer transport protein ExbB/TolQ